jgi:hypothetical protein
MSEIARAEFDFDGLDESLLTIHPGHGPCFRSEAFIRWAGWSRPSDVRRDHLRPGDEVEISTSIRRGQGVTKRDVLHLTKRGVRRLLFRSNHPRAVDYADRVLDMLDELDRTGMVIDERRITDEQIEQGHERLAGIARRRLEERMDYKTILHSLKLGGAVSDDYRTVQNTLYLGLFGMTAAQIRATQPQRTGMPRKRGGGLRKSRVAKDYMTEGQLKLLNVTVLATVAQIELHYPNGANAGQMVDAVNRAIRLVSTPPRRGVGGAA